MVATWWIVAVLSCITLIIETWPNKLESFFIAAKISYDKYTQVYHLVLLVLCPLATVILQQSFHYVLSLVFEPFTSVI